MKLNSWPLALGPRSPIAPWTLRDCLLRESKCATLAKRSNARSKTGANNMYRHHTKCRACGNETLVPVFDLGDQPLANSFSTNSNAELIPRKVLFCARCPLTQLSVVVDPATLYKDYCYVTSRSESLDSHLANLFA